MFTELLSVLKTRFEANMHRHPGLEWQDVSAALQQDPAALRALQAMEDTGGEPDVIGTDCEGRCIFCDCSPESPVGRRGLCYDGQGQRERERKGVFPARQRGGYGCRNGDRAVRRRAVPPPVEGGRVRYKNVQLA